MKNNQCPMCGDKVFEKLNEDGWCVLCKTCDYTTETVNNRYVARCHYRDDFNREFEKTSVEIDVKPWQEKLDRGEI